MAQQVKEVSGNGLRAGQESTAAEREWAKYFKYLDGLRESGRTNMWGGGRYLEKGFAMSRDDASRVLTSWMATFSDEAPLARAKAALSKLEGK